MLGAGRETRHWFEDWDVLRPREEEREAVGCSALGGRRNTGWVGAEGTGRGETVAARRWEGGSSGESPLAGWTLIGRREREVLVLALH